VLIAANFEASMPGKDISEDLRTLLPIAATVVLYSIPESRIPGVMSEIKEFINDRGAVHYVFLDYFEHGNLEKMLVNFWDSRTSESSFRVEVALAAILLSLALSVVANVLYDLGKDAAPKVRDRIKNFDFIRLISKNRNKDKDNAITLYNLLMLRNYIYSTPGVDDRKEFFKIVEFLKGGGSLKNYIKSSTNFLPQDLNALENFDVVARGLLLDGPIPQTPKSQQWDKVVAGMPLSDRSCFGEILNCHTPDFIGIGQIKKLIGLKTQFSNAWPVDYHYWPTPKVLFLDDRFFTEVFQQLSVVEIETVVGFVTRTGGLTCHTAITCWGIGKPAICAPRIRDFINDYKFAAIENGALFLNKAFPTFIRGSLDQLMLYQIRKRE
jgi:hypothetical protein